MGANPFSACFSETGSPPTARELAAAMRAGLERRCLFPPGNRRGELHYYANTLGNPISVKPTPYAKAVHLLRKAFKVLLRPWLEMQTRYNQAAIEALEKLHSNLYALQNKVASLEADKTAPLVQVHAPGPVPAGASLRILEQLFVQTHLPAPPARLLDLGCIDSTNALEMASLGYQVVGMNLRNWLFSIRSFQMISGDVAPLPFPDASFDGVVSLSTLAHVGLSEESPDHKLVEEIRRVLKPGGRLLLSAPFGRSTQTSDHRVYDRATLDRLLAPLRRVETAFGLCEGDAWSWATDGARAESVDSVQRVNAVALVAAEKN